MNKKTVGMKNLLFTAALILSCTVNVYAAETEIVSNNGGGYAASGQLSDVGYISEIYDATNGLPTSDANYIFASSDGYIWIGGYSGIIRYDGTTFERMDATAGLTSGRSIFEDSLKRIWVGTNDNGVVVIENGSFRRYTYEDGLRSSSIRTFAEGGDGIIYIGSTAGISNVDTTGKLSDLDDDRINDKTIVRLTADRNGIVYGSTKDGCVFSLSASKIAKFMTHEELGLETVSTIYASPDESGMVYIGTESNSLYYGPFGEGAFSLRRINVSPINDVYWITSACKRIWVTSENVAGYIDEGYQFHVLHNIPMNNSIDMMTADYQGNLWFASSRQGVMKVVTNNFQDITERAGIDPATVNSTCVFRGLVYVGTDTGLYILDGKNNKVVENALTSFLSDTRIRCIMKDDMDNLWFSTYTNDIGLVCLSAFGRISTYNDDNGMPGSKIRCTATAKDGSILVGTNDGLAVIKDGEIKTPGADSPVITNNVFLTVCEGDNGVIYAGTDGDGIYGIKGDEVMRLGRLEGLTSDVILRIKKDEKRGLYWIITSNSIEYMKDGIITNVDTFPYNNNFDLFDDGEGNMWILSSMGVYCVKAQDMVDNKIENFKLYNYANGLPGAPTANSFSAMDEEGNLYIAERTGVCLVNLKNFYEQEGLIRVGIKSVLCNNQEIVPDENGKYTIPATKGRIQITPAVLDYSMSNPLVNVYLEGAGDQGITAEQNRLTSLEYTDLKYGDYKLHIRILDQSSNRVYQDDVFNIVKKPMLSELLIVRLLGALLVALLAGFIVWRVMTGTIITRQYEQIRRAKEEAERANSAKSRFLANMSHEIRTPINTIMGMDEMILREDSKDVPKGYFMSVINYALDIRSASESLLGLVNDLLDMSKIESGKMHLVEQGYDVADLLRSIVKMIRVKASEKDLKFDVDIDKNIPRRLYGDSGKIKQVVLNLLTNAVKYTEEGGFTLKVLVEDKTENDCGLRFSVKDTGIGVKSEDMDKLFTAYERLDEEKNSAIQGTGLGLDISRRFAELMNGKLWCESVYGEGSEFILTVRQNIEDPEPVGVFKEQEESAKGPYVPLFVSPDADILVVDDNPMNLSVIKGLLKATKVFVTTASSGEECLEKIKYGSFNVVLLDHMMPGMDGVETMERIREDHPDLPVYALTANSTVGEDFYISKGFTGYLSKPIDSRALESAIMKHLPEEMMMKPSVADTESEPDTLPEDMKWLYNVDGINVEDGIKNSGGVSSFVNSVKLFVDTMEDSSKVIRTAYEENDIRLYTIKVHALKSSARIIGATSLSKLAEKLEDAGNKQDMEFIDSNAQALLDEYLAFGEKFAPIKAPADDAGKEDIPEAELKDAYEALRELIPQMDYDSVEMVIDNLRAYKLPEEDDRKISEIEKKMKVLDWDGMAEVMGQA